MTAPQQIVGYNLVKPFTSPHNIALNPLIITTNNILSYDFLYRYNPSTLPELIVTSTLSPINIYNQFTDTWSILDNWKSMDGTNGYEVPVTGTNFSAPENMTRTVRFGYGSLDSRFELTGMTEVTVYSPNSNAIRAIDAPIISTEIGAYAFVGCDTLQRITIPDGCVRIGDGAYLNCENARGVVCLPMGLQRVGSCAFAGTNITSLLVPPTVVECGEYVIPDQASVVLLADSSNNLTPALAEIFSHLSPTNIVFVTSIEAMIHTMPYMDQISVRILSKPVPPINLAVSDILGGVQLVWESIERSWVAPTMSYTVMIKEINSDQPVIFYENVSSPVPIRGLTVGKEYAISVTAKNIAGETPSAEIHVTL
jgi:hypothetical protein